MIAGLSGHYGVHSESADYVGGSTIHLTTNASSCVGQDEHNTIATQQEDDGRSGASGDDMNNTSGIKGSGHGWIITMYLCVLPSSSIYVDY